MKNTENLGDEEIIEITRTKDKQMYLHIIKRYEDKLIRYVGNLSKDNQNTIDIVQETFIKAYKNLQAFDVNRKFSSWIYRIAHNETINFINKNRKQININEYLEFDSGIDIEDEYIKRELNNKAHRCLNQMPLIYKEPLSLHFIEEKSYEEISDILRVSMGTVGVRINRAKILMKKICLKI